MPGFLEQLEVRLATIENTLTEVADLARASALPDCPLTPDESAWADGALSVKEACAFLTVKQSKLFELMRSGELVSAFDGRRLIAKRGCIRYLLAHQEHAAAVG